MFCVHSFYGSTLYALQEEGQQLIVSENLFADLRSPLWQAKANRT